MTALTPITTRGHRPRIGKELRVPFPSTRVDQSTDAQFTQWMKAGDSKIGVMLDRVARFAKSHGFTGREESTKKGPSPSTAHGPNQIRSPQRAGYSGLVNRKQ